MGVTEAVLHGFDILAAQGIGYRPDDVVVSRVLDRIFPAAERTGDPWQDLFERQRQDPRNPRPEVALGLVGPRLRRRGAGRKPGPGRRLVAVLQ